MHLVSDCSSRTWGLLGLLASFCSWRPWPARCSWRSLDPVPARAGRPAARRSGAFRRRATAGRALTASREPAGSPSGRAHPRTAGPDRNALGRPRRRERWPSGRRPRPMRSSQSTRAGTPIASVAADPARALEELRREEVARVVLRADLLRVGEPARRPGPDRRAAQRRGATRRGRAGRAGDRRARAGDRVEAEQEVAALLEETSGEPRSSRVATARRAARRRRHVAGLPRRGRWAAVPTSRSSSCGPQFAADPALAPAVPARGRAVAPARSSRASCACSIPARTPACPFLVLELVRGETLRQRLDRDGKLPSGEARSIFIRSRGRSIMRTAAGSSIATSSRRTSSSPTPALKLGDFGNARVVSLASVTGASLTWGTPEYVAPGGVRARAAPIHDPISIRWASCCTRC